MAASPSNISSPVLAVAVGVIAGGVAEVGVEVEAAFVGMTTGELAGVPFPVAPLGLSVGASGVFSAVIGGRGVLVGMLVGRGVAVGGTDVAIGVAVGVLVGTGVGVSVAVDVWVGVFVGVWVGVSVGVCVGV